MTDQIIEGGSRCGAIRYRARGEPLWVNHCYYLDCRGTSGAPFMTWATFKTADVSFTKGAPRVFPSSKTAERRFCPDCGTQLVWAAKSPPERIDLTAGSMDEPERLRPDYHLFTRRRIAWLHLDDGLPEYQEWKTGGG